MAVKSEELLTVACLMPQNHERAVILWRGIVGEDVHHAIERSAEPRSCFYKKIDAQVNRSALFYRVLHTSKSRRTVKRPRFVISTNSHAHASAFHLSKYFLRKRRSLRSAWICTQHQTPDAQIENETWRSAQVNIKDRRHRF